LSDLRDQSDLNALATDAGTQLAGHFWSTSPEPLRGYQRFTQLRAFEMTEQRARDLARSLAREVIAEWSRFRGQDIQNWPRSMAGLDVNLDDRFLVNLRCQETPGSNSVPDTQPQFFNAFESKALTSLLMIRLSSESWRQKLSSIVPNLSRVSDYRPPDLLISSSNPMSGVSCAHSWATLHLQLGSFRWDPQAKIRPLLS
jgi:hypothetical protein